MRDPILRAWARPQDQTLGAEESVVGANSDDLDAECDDVGLFLPT